MRVVCALRHGTLCRNTPSMPLFEIVVLAIVQGITEFLPVSSSGHLRVASELMGITSDTLVMDVAVHVGTLGAVTLYLWRDVARIAKGLIHACLCRRDRKSAASGKRVSVSVEFVGLRYTKNKNLHK